MARIAIILTLVCSICVLNPIPQQAIAQTPQDLQMTESTGTRKQIATIIFAGLAGAILGLSTLSFYGRPQDKLSNIAIGFAIGVIAGATYTTYKTATQPYEYYGLYPELENSEQLAQFAKPQKINPQLGFSYSWEF